MMKVIIQGHAGVGCMVKNDLKRTLLHCLHCGAQDVWQESYDAGDWLEGVGLYCIRCNCEFALSSMRVSDNLKFVEGVFNDPIESFV